MEINDEKIKNNNNKRTYSLKELNWLIQSDY